MTAKELYTEIAKTYTNSYFASYEELNLTLDTATYPCAVIVPISKQVQFVSDRFKTIETVVVASLDVMPLDFETATAYDDILKLENELLGTVYPFMDYIRNIQVLSELNKFDSNVLFAAFSFELMHNSVCPENMKPQQVPPIEEEEENENA